MLRLRQRDDGPEAEPQWLGGRRWTALAAIAFLLLLAVAAVLVVTVGGDDAPTQPTSPSGVATRGPGGEAVNPARSTADDSWNGTTVPPGVSWELFHGIPVPTSPTAGPAQVAGDVATGFAHNRVGALLAAAQISTRYLFAGDEDWKEAALMMLAPGPGRDAWMRTREPRSVDIRSVPAGTLRQLAGFQFVSYSPAETVIQLVSRSSRDNSLQVVPVHLVRHQGDWRLVPAGDGGVAASAQFVPSLTGFVPWGLR